MTDFVRRNNPLLQAVDEAERRRLMPAPTLVKRYLTKKRRAVMMDRSLFSSYAQRATYAAKQRAQKAGIPFAIDADFIDRLLVDQKWRCAVSGIKLVPRQPNQGKGAMDAFGPSLDRIIPSQGYVPGNVRMVCNIVNSAMNQWGLETLMQVIKAIQEAGERG